MPIHEVNHLNTQQAYLVWNIKESEEELLTQFKPTLTKAELSTFKNNKRRLEWLASRIAYKKLCQQLDIPCNSILKDGNGRPYPSNKNHYISLSHCFPYAVAALSQHTPIGIDIQIPHIKLQFVQEKYLNKSEIEEIHQDLEKLCIYWCAKEAIYKAHHQNGLSFRAISIKSFEKAKQGTTYAQIRDRHTYLVNYYLESPYTLVWCQMIS
jgi:phosphopantetheinyl transferase